MQNKNGKGKRPQEDTPDGGHASQRQPQKSADDLFDQQVRAMLAEAEVASPEAFFDRIEAALRPASPRRRLLRKSGAFYGYAAAAAILLALLSGVLWHYRTAGGNHRDGRLLARTDNIAPLTPQEAGTQTVMHHPLTALPESLQAVILSDAGLEKEVPAERIARIAKLPAADRLTKEDQDTADYYKKEMLPATVGRAVAIAAPAKPRRAQATHKRQDVLEMQGAFAAAPSARPEQAQSVTASVGSVPSLASAPAGDMREQAAALGPEQHLPGDHPEQSVTGIASVKKPVLPGPGPETAKTAIAAAPSTEEPKGPKELKEQVAVALGAGNSPLLHTEDHGLAVNGRRPEDGGGRKKGFLNGIFKQVKDGVNALSERVVDNEGDKTTYSLGFIAVTAYK